MTALLFFWIGAVVGSVASLLWAGRERDEADEHRQARGEHPW
jgi:gas vesicle protein